MKYILTRDILISECKWLERDFAKGEIVYLYEGASYNCISKFGLPFTVELETEPFFEIPKNAVCEIEDDGS